MILLSHQSEFVKINPRKAILAWGTRVGKTLAICGWMKNRLPSNKTPIEMPINNDVNV